jgi:phytanoyl-CoA hydroxylase
VPGLEAAKAAEEADGFDPAAFKCEPCKAGSLVLIGRVVHKSERNLSENSRFAYTFHIIEGDESKAVYECVFLLSFLDRRSARAD